MSIDNGNLESKLNLRRWFLREYHAEDELHVFDACQGTGLIWNRLRAEFPLASYWGVDVKPKAGRVQVNSVRLLEAGLDRQNILDVDTYGSPWKHWAALLPHIKRPTTVFLTIGKAINGAALGIDSEMVKWLGLGDLRNVPPMLKSKAAERFGFESALRQAERAGLKIQDAREAQKTRTARYIGVFLTPVSPSG